MPNLAEGNAHAASPEPATTEIAPFPLGSRGFRRPQPWFSPRRSTAGSAFDIAGTGASALRQEFGESQHRRPPPRPEPALDLSKAVRGRAVSTPAFVL